MRLWVEKFFRLQFSFFEWEKFLWSEPVDPLKHLGVRLSFVGTFQSIWVLFRLFYWIFLKIMNEICTTLKNARNIWSNWIKFFSNVRSKVWSVEIPRFLLALSILQYSDEITHVFEVKFSFSFKWHPIVYRKRKIFEWYSTVHTFPAFLEHPSVFLREIYAPLGCLEGMKSKKISSLLMNIGPV